MAGPWSYHYEQENLSAEQPASCEGPRIPAPHAHSRRPCHPRCASPQGPHRAFRLVIPRLLLAKANRVTRPEDFRRVVRRGHRAAATSTVLYSLRSDESTAVRFGFIVSKSVGGAVVRNRIRRRLRAISSELLPTVPGGTDVVVRGLPGSDTTEWRALLEEVRHGITSSTDRS
jgi:ribonuclease P protein component